MLEKTKRFRSDSSRPSSYDYETERPKPVRYPYDRTGAPQPYEFVRERPVRERTFTVARILTASVVVATAAGIGALFSSDIIQAVIVNTRASFVTASTLVDASQPTAVAPTGPSREEISAVLKSAAQVQAAAPQVQAAAPQIQAAVTPQIQSDVRQLAPPVAAPSAPQAPRVEKIDPETLAGIMSRAKKLMATGDISAARLLLERVAGQEADAALLLGESYDPAVLGTQDIRSIGLDAAIARSWYLKAAQLGSADAQRRLSVAQYF